MAETTTLRLFLVLTFVYMNLVAGLAFKKGVLHTLCVSQDASGKENTHRKGYI